MGLRFYHRWFLILTFYVSSASATNYYVATTGSDGNNGLSTGSPFASWQKLSSVMVAGDTGFIRGGTYRSLIAIGNSATYLLDWTFSGSSGSHCVITNYPGESPVMNFDNFTSLNVFRVGVHVLDCTYTDFIGLRITGLPQVVGTPQQNSEGMRVERTASTATTITFTRCEWDHIQGPGCRVTSNTSSKTVVQFINCDSHENGDPHDGGGGVYGNADGFDANNGQVTYIGCRAWWNSDDGFDAFGNDTLCTYINCWSFWNGYQPGTFTDPGSQADGDGFKWGNVTTVQSSTVLRKYGRCLSFQNKHYAFDQNTAACIAWFYNNTSMGNAQGFAMNYSMGGNPDEANVLRNNVSFNDVSAGANFASPIVHDHNTWNGGVTLTSGDFVSTDTSGIEGARQSDGSLPNTNFLHLVSGSDLKNAGVTNSDFTGMGLTYSGSAPDMGYFEFIENVARGLLFLF